MLLFIQQWESYRIFGLSLCSLVTSGHPLSLIHDQRTHFPLWGNILYQTASTERLDGRSSVPDASTSLQLVTPSFLFVLFSPMWKGSKVSLFLYNMLLEFTSITYKMDINRDGMGPFMPTSRSPSLSIALKFSCADHPRVLCR
jgi:hypothetical protein